ncbi:MAG: hypothetical protein J0M13_14790 [Candidatus Accumulibacter sp.]|nr:hypothetical protein [Candidatus Accumulibacter necessarius]
MSTLIETRNQRRWIIEASVRTAEAERAQEGKSISSRQSRTTRSNQSILAFLSTVNAEKSGLENPDHSIFCPYHQVPRRDFFQGARRAEFKSARSQGSRCSQRGATRLKCPFHFPLSMLNDSLRQEE